MRVISIQLSPFPKTKRKTLETVVCLSLARQAPVSGHIQVTTLVAAYESHSQKRPDLVMDTFFYVQKVSAYDSFHRSYYPSKNLLACIYSLPS